MTCFLPPYLLRELARRRPERAAELERMLAADEEIRLLRQGPPRRAALVAGPAWTVHDAEGGTELPGRPARSAGEPETGDPAVDEAAYGVAGALAMFEEVYGRSSYDGTGAPVVATVHYGRDYVNAFWDGAQLVFGDGDGEVFARFTRPVDVVGHELAHAVTEHTAALAYQGQSGALNESVSDVFAACLEQRLRGQSAVEADWLIGSDLFLPGVAARGLRDMAAPGTAYDDPALGQDPQPAHLDDYVDTTEDNGGVHINSGIPNRAFHLAATAIGGSSAEGAGRIWYAALTGGEVGARTDFAGFAAATLAVAGEHTDVVREAWATVGVTPAAPSASSSGPGLPPPVPVPGRRVLVSRSGGFLGRTVAGEVDLGRGGLRADEVAALVDRVDLASVAGGAPKPDMYVYDFDLCGDRARVPEQHLTPDLRRIADLVLERDPADPTR
ncbi:M4 family metallopeptidase [Nocardioides sp.]|uniref:M4 family metallopeptidase n=1 Tax=Nocardioides sp. TaxID=35761 RepID=UPI001A314A77|nr:M4 family metallopeptidase [Nocardioides sp.]MBJ7357675.1 M4 family metallopeptidase [Nocardioides sp.]